MKETKKEAKKRRGRKPKDGIAAKTGSQRAKASRKRQQAAQQDVFRALTLAVGEMLSAEQIERLEGTYPAAIDSARSAYKAAEAGHQAEIAPSPEPQNENAAPVVAAPTEQAVVEPAAPKSKTKRSKPKPKVPEAAADEESAKA